MKPGEKINQLEVKLTPSEQERERKTVKSQDSIKLTHIPVTDVPGEERKGTEILCEEIMARNLSNLGKGIDIHNQEVQKVANERNLSRPTQKYTIIKMPNVKGKEH